MQPNLILITTDQQRFDCLGINRHPELRTPWLDSMAARGINFTRAYTTCPVCVPARRTIISGQHTATHGLNRYAEGRPFDPPATLPGLLRDAGYQTQLIGKFHVSDPGRRLGFDHIIQSETPNDRRDTAMQRRNDYADWFEQRSDAPHTLYMGTMSNDRHALPWTLPDHLHHTNWVTNTAADFLCKYRDPTCPFFLHLSYWAPHQPHLPPQAYFDRYADNTWDPAIGRWVGHREHEPGLRLDAKRGPFSKRETHEMARGYYGLINHIDDQLNYLFDRWRPSGLMDRDRPTWVLFTTDHGEQLGEHHLFRKELPYEGSAHIPMFLAPLTGAEVDTPGESDALVTLEDIMPTMLDLAGLPTPDHLGDEDGRSLAPAIEGKPHGRGYVHGECWWRGRHHRYLVRGRWKYVRWTGTGEEQLFDVVDDPQELHDRSGEEDLADFRAAVDSHRDAVQTGGDDHRDVTLRPCDNGPPDAIWDGPEF